MPGQAKKPRAEALSREAVVDAALELARAKGLEGLTMRAVASELGVTPMALYYHIANKDELVELVAAQVLAGTVPLKIGSEDWPSALREHMLSTWQELSKYPGLASYMINLPTLGNTAESFRQGTAFLEEIGFDPRAAELAWSFVLTYIHGRLSVDSRLDAEAAREVGLTSMARREHVEFGVAAVIVALKAMLDGPESVERFRPAGR